MASTPLLLLIRPLTPLIMPLLALALHHLLHFLSFSMTPLYDLNLPPSSFPTVEDQGLQLFLSPRRDHHPPPAFFNTTHQDQIGSNKLSEESSYQMDDHKVDKFLSHSSARDHKLFSPSSSFQVAIEAQKLSSSKKEHENYNERSGDGSDKWMPSKMRIIQKMMNSNCSESNNKPVTFTLKLEDYQKHQANNNDMNSSFSSNIRVCSDCNTTTTPLWRSGPRGPKSLCNACGIRQRKARRAMAAAAAAAAATGNGTVSAMETSSSSASSTKTKVKEKKSRTSHCKKLYKAVDHSPRNHNHGQKTKISFKNLALSLSKNSALQRVFPRDVEEAAILLMELSCGLIHS